MRCMGWAKALGLAREYVISAMFDAQVFAELSDPICGIVSLLCSHNCDIVGVFVRMNIMVLHRALEELVVGQGL